MYFLIIWWTSPHPCLWLTELNLWLAIKEVPGYYNYDTIACFQLTCGMLQVCFSAFLFCSFILWPNLKSVWRLLQASYRMSAYISKNKMSVKTLNICPVNFIRITKGFSYHHTLYFLGIELPCHLFYANSHFVGDLGNPKQTREPSGGSGLWTAARVWE